MSENELKWSTQRPISTIFVTVGPIPRFAARKVRKSQDSG